MRVVSREEAQQTRQTKAPGVRRARMDTFDGYARLLIDNPAEAVVYEDLGEEPSKFVLSLRGAFKRAGVPAVVRKMRSRDEVRAWVGEPTTRTHKTQKPGSGRGRRRAS